jgi:hypothetical protein
LAAVVPPSLGEDIVKALLSIDAINDPQLLEMTRDCRLARVVDEKIQERTLASTAFLDDILRQVSSSEIAPRHLIETLRTKKTFAACTIA